MYSIIIASELSAEEVKTLKATPKYVRIQGTVEALNELCEAEEAIKAAQLLLERARTLAYRGSQDKELDKKLKEVSKSLEQERRKRERGARLQAVIQEVKYEPPPCERSDSEELETQQLLEKWQADSNAAYEKASQVREAHLSCVPALERIRKQKVHLEAVLRALMSHDIGWLMEVNEEEKE